MLTAKLDYSACHCIDRCVDGCEAIDADLYEGGVLVGGATMVPVCGGSGHTVDTDGWWGDIDPHDIDEAVRRALAAE